MDKTKAGYLEGIVSIIVNCILFVLKMGAALYTGSIALAADAWHTLSDSLSSIVVIVGTKLATKKADKEHPFGHGRWEHITSFIVAMILGIIAYDFMKDSIIQLQNRDQVIFGTLAIVATIISILAKEGLAQYALYLGRKTNNLSVIADAWHHRSDALSSVIILIGIFVSKYFWWMDGVLGIIVSLLLFYATFQIAKSAINKILGEDLDPKLVEEIITEINLVSQKDCHPHHFHIHNYESHKELTFHIRLSTNVTIGEGHDIASQIEDMIKKKYDMDTTIHLEPYQWTLE